MDGWQWSHLVVGSTSRLPFPASIPESCILKLGVAIAFTLYSLISQFVYDLESPALLRFLQASGHINSYGMVRIRVPYIPPRGGSPTRRLFRALHPYFTPKRLARMIGFYHESDLMSMSSGKFGMVWGLTVYSLLSCESFGVLYLIVLRC
ncbi:hypothetical protein APLC1_4475 [Limnospira platensis C1]|nr:hypothetical protein APLC1_4475 [Arthrospira platensis C1]